MARQRFDLLPAGTNLQRRFALAQVLGPPRARTPWHPPGIDPAPGREAEPSPAAPAEPEEG